MTSGTVCREANVEDLDRLLPLCRAFCEHFDYRFSEPQKREDVLGLLAHPELGRIFLVLDQSAVAGYLILAFSYSLEYGGRTAFIDEFFIGDASRGRGLGKKVLAFIEPFCRECGVHAVLLETEESNPRAAAIYQTAGYGFLGRRLMTRVLDPGRGYK